MKYFGDTYVQKIGAGEIESYLAHAVTEILFRGKPLSKETANKHWAHLHTLMEYAKRHPGKYGIKENPVDLVTPFKCAEKEHVILNSDEVLKMMQALRGLDRPDFEVAVNLAIWCSVRREETYGLRWRNVDFDEDVIRIRDIRTTAKGRVIEREYTHFLKRYEFKKIRYHDLRHTAASLLLTKLPATTVAEILGHQQVSTTLNIYAHAVSKSSHAGREAMDAILGNDSKQKKKTGSAAPV